MKYNTEKHKIKKIFTQKEELSRKSKDIEKQEVVFGAINYHERRRNYDTEWFDVNNLGNNFRFSVELKNFPERAISFIKILPVFKTNETWEETSPTFNVSFLYFAMSRKAPIEYAKSDYILSGHVGCTLEDDDDNAIPLYFKLFITLTNEGSYHEIRFHKT